MKVEMLQITKFFEISKMFIWLRHVLWQLYVIQFDADLILYNSFLVNIAIYLCYAEFV